MMKTRVMALILAGLLMLSLVACGTGSNAAPETPGSGAESGENVGTGSEGNNTGTGNENNSNTGTGENNSGTGESNNGSGENDNNTGTGDNNFGTGENNSGTGESNNGGSTAGGDNNSGNSTDTDADNNNDNNNTQTPVDPDTVLLKNIWLDGKNYACEGGALSMSVHFYPENATNKTIRWSIASGADLATIDPQTGLITAKKAGEIVVKAETTDGSKRSATRSVTIYPAAEKEILVEGLAIYRVDGLKTDPVYAGQTIQFGVLIEPFNASNQQVTWSLLRGEDIASIDENGVLTTRGEGSVWVNAQSTDGSNKVVTYALVIEAPLPWKGSGTEKDPYLVGNAEELRAIRQRLGDYVFYFKQTADIDLSDCGEWAPLGGNETHTYFRHHYDGDGYSIRNVEMPSYGQGSVFGYCVFATFKNLHIENAYTTAAGHQAGSIGAFSHYAKGTTFENCSAAVNFRQKSGKTNSMVGGLVGVLEPSGTLVVMKNCHTSGVIEANTAGGLLGMLQCFDRYAKDKYRLENCSSSVTVKDSGNGNVGGLAGILSNMTVESCTFSGQVTSIGANSGGLVGKAMDNCTLKNCTVTGTVTGSTNCDPLVGTKFDTVQIINCTAQ